MSYSVTHCFINNKGASRFGIKITFVGDPGITSVLSNTFPTCTHGFGGANAFAKGTRTTPVLDRGKADLTVVTVAGGPPMLAEIWLLSDLVTSGGSATEIACTLAAASPMPSDPIGAVAVEWTLVRANSAGADPVRVTALKFDYYQTRLPVVDPNITAEVGCPGGHRKPHLLKPLSADPVSYAGGGTVDGETVLLPPGGSVTFRVVIVPEIAEYFTVPVVSGETQFEVDKAEIVTRFACQGVAPNSPAPAHDGEQAAAVC